MPKEQRRGPFVFAKVAWLPSHWAISNDNGEAICIFAESYMPNDLVVGIMLDALYFDEWDTGRHEMDDFLLRPYQGGHGPGHEDHSRAMPPP